MKRKSRHSRRIPRVIAVVSMQSNYGPSVLRGVFAHIAAHGEWGLEILRTASAFTGDTVRQAIAHKIDGFVIALNEDCPDAFQALAASDIPFVTVETYSPVLAAGKREARHFRINNAGIGHDAARNFLRQGRYSSFGFVHPRIARPWSEQRAEGFGRELALRGRALDVFSGIPANDTVVRRGELAKWVRRLDKPAALLAADDATSLEVIQACQSAKLKIPDEVAVLGVDDEPIICESVLPMLSSIRPAFASAGRQAAEALERLMRGRDAQASETSIVRGRNEIVVRASTRPESISGMLVQRAIAFIQANARNGIGVKDVQAHLGVSRALMDLRFREVRGESVLSVITKARLKELKNALKSSDEPIGEITERLGWTSPNYPKNLFRKRFGCSMLAWRKQSRGAS